MTAGSWSAACLAAAGIAAHSASGVGIVEQGDMWTVTNAHYAATFDGSKGGALVRLSVGGTSFGVAGEFVCGLDGQNETYDGRSHVLPVEFPQMTQKNVRRDAAERLPDGSLAVKLAWDAGDGMSVVQKCVFDESAAVRFGVRLSWNKPAAWAYYRLMSDEVDSEKCVFQPENRMFAGVNNASARSCLPRWKYLCDGRRAFGLVMLQRGDWDHFRFHSQMPARGWKRMTCLELRHAYLAGEAAPGGIDMAFALIATFDEVTAMETANALLKDVPEVQLTDLEPDGAHSKRRGGNGLTTTLVNNTGRHQKVRLVSEYDWSLDKTVPVADECVTLSPFERRRYHVRWRYPSQVEWGVAAKLAAYDMSGRLLDRRADVTAVTDFAPAAVGVSILTATMCCQDGFEDAWAERMKRMYIGLFEYYAWSPSTWDADRMRGMSPTADSWRPVSSDTRADRLPLTKKFVKGLVDSCHRNGVDVYAWVTLLTDFKMALAHPECFQYCRNGQLAIYSGDESGGERIAIAKLDPYDVGMARDWGEQMADSVDMFGWDGCRFDSGFVPHAPNDPLYHSLVGDVGADMESYNWKGVSHGKLYPDHDGTGCEALRAWRQAVARRHPDFVYGANIHATRKMFDYAPRYMKEQCSGRSMVLFEYLLDLCRKYPTYGRWAEELSDTVLRTRACGAQSIVGHITSLCEGSVGERLARLTCISSGSKWWGGPNEFRYWGSRRCVTQHATRFSEYFYSPDLKRANPGAVSVDAGGKVLWRPFAFERCTHEGREVAVHIVNADPDEFIVRKQLPPILRRNVAVSVAVRAGEKIKSAFALLPGMEPKAVRLPVDGTKVVLPVLDEAASVVVRISQSE